MKSKLMKNEGIEQQYGEKNEAEEEETHSITNEGEKENRTRIL